MATLTSAQVMTATDELVAAFAATDTAAHFACRHISLIDYRARSFTR